MLISVVIPAFNEEAYLGATLGALHASAAQCPASVQVIVVDNGSTDATAKIARDAGAEVVCEAIHNVGRVRNTGARTAKGDVLVFLDADTLVPPNFLPRIAEVMADPRCAGGTADISHRPSSRVIQTYLLAWRWLDLLLGMAQGAAQFCRRDAFEGLHGYDESQFMGEDVDFYWRLRKLRGSRVEFLADVQVVPSPRRFDQWPVWRTLVWTNPLFVLVFRKSRTIWGEWYERPPR